MGPTGAGRDDDAGRPAHVDDPLAAPPPARPRTWWQTYGTDSPLAVLFAAALATLVLLAGLVKWLYPDHRTPGRPRTTCANHLRQFGGIFTMEEMEGRAPTAGGAALLFSWVRKGYVQRGREGILVCPEDPDALARSAADGLPLYLTVDTTDAVSMAPLCSYAVRDLARFPIDADATDPETGEVAWLACDRQGTDGRTPHHRDGINVLYADGAVRFEDREFLGIAEDEPIVVGPASTHPELKKMVFVPGQ